MNIRCIVNGQPVELDVEPERRAVDVLREELGLLGTKEGCGGGDCGACAVLVDGMTRLSCLMLAAQLEGRAVTTAEGLGAAGSPHPVQQAFAELGAVQCGYCTPGMAITAAELLERAPSPDRRTIREALSGNLCRCTGYQQIIQSIEAAAEAMSTPHREDEA